MCMYVWWLVFSVNWPQSPGKSLSERLSRLGWRVGMSMRDFPDYLLRQKSCSLWMAPLRGQGMLDCGNVKRVLSTSKLLTVHMTSYFKFLP